VLDVMLPGLDGFGAARQLRASHVQTPILMLTARDSANDNWKGGEIKNIGKETEHGVTQYEVETMLNGKHRDFEVDTKGALLVVEEGSHPQESRRRETRRGGSFFDARPGNDI
jgi:CheY-like chemotaxis protein